MKSILKYLRRLWKREDPPPPPSRKKIRLPEEDMQNLIRLQQKLRRIRRGDKRHNGTKKK